MTHPVLSTYKILKDKAFNSDIDESWAHWAIEMIEAGFESKSLYELAGIEIPFNQFVLQELTDRVLSDLGLSFTDTKIVIENYCYFIIKNSIPNSESYYKVLKELKNICIDLDHAKKYFDFYLLFFAKDDLLVDTVQWYWDGADRENIDRIIHDYFIQWVKKLENRVL